MTAQRSEAAQQGTAGQKEGPNPFYGLLLFFAVAFTFTCLLYVATDLWAGESERSAVVRFMERYGGWLLLVEGGLIVATSLASMAYDSWRWRGMKRVTKRRSGHEGS